MNHWKTILANEIYAVIFFNGSLAKIEYCSFESVHQCLHFISSIDSEFPNSSIGILNKTTGEILSDFPVKQENIETMNECFLRISKMEKQWRKI